jgi:hypothetical protein
VEGVNIKVDYRVGGLVRHRTIHDSRPSVCVKPGNYTLVKLQSTKLNLLLENTHIFQLLHVLTGAS